MSRVTNLAPERKGGFGCVEWPIRMWAKSCQQNSPSGIRVLMGAEFFCRELLVR